MNISFEIPQEIERALKTNGADLNREAKEAFLVEQYRNDKISQHQLAQALGLSRYEADGVLKRHGVALETTVDELRAEGEFLRRMRPV
jgi:predicted HTH domain antitoxin